MDYQQLLTEYNKLLEENAILKKENAILRKLQLLPEQIVEIEANPIVISNESSINNYSTTKDKIELFMSLFKGRSDVYAKRWQAMRLSTYEKPRIISTAEETDYFIAIPRGCERNLLEMFDEANAQYEINDETNPGKEIEVTQIYNTLAENELRNKLIVKDVANALNHGRNPIILTERSEHVITFAKMLEGKCDQIISLVGSATAKEKRESMAKLQELRVEESFVIIATGKYVGEGFDFPRLDTLFLAMPIAWKGKIAQYAGRLHRLYAGKDEVLIYDYIDVHIPVLERMYHKRVKGYAAIGYRTRADVQDMQKMNIIHDGITFLPVLDNDIITAKKYTRRQSVKLNQNHSH